MSFSLPSGNLFLALNRERNVTVLYFSREGLVRTVTVPSPLPVPRE